MDGGSLTRFVVIGLGGYGLAHIEAVRWLARQGFGKLVGVVALEADRQARPEVVQSLKAEGARLYANIEDFLHEGLRVADALTVPIGIHQHVPVSVAALEAGLHVYCEKPAAATVQEVDVLIAASHRTGKHVAIGFQHMSSLSVQRLKSLLGEGRLGAVHDLTLMCGWPRSLQYFRRNEWSGRLRLGDRVILDSPANNAHAHYLMNALFLAGPRRETAAIPVKLRAELYRANPIESADTTQLSITTETGVRLHILLTHANGFANGPVMDLQCEGGRAYWQTDEGSTFIRYNDGSTEEFDNRAHPQWRFGGFRNFVETLAGRARPDCPPEVARAQTLAVNLMHESCSRIVAVPSGHVVEVEDWEMHSPNTRGAFCRIQGLDAAMHIAFQERAFLSTLGLPWTRAVETREVTGEGYNRFDIL
jgi:predicted dehydrogenase